MNEPNLDVRDNYTYFEELTYAAKNISKNPIILEPKKNNSDWMKQSANVDHSTIKERIALIVEKKRSLYKYGIKLHCPNFTKKPYFRFDSDGPAHRNNADAPLTGQLVTTPHFNSFDKKGHEFAYKSDTLKDEGNANAIAGNIQFGISLFFQETNLKLNNSENFPEITISKPELFKTEPETDPLNGIDFLD